MKNSGEWQVESVYGEESATSLIIANYDLDKHDIEQKGTLIMSVGFAWFWMWPHEWEEDVSYGGTQLHTCSL